MENIGGIFVVLICGLIIAVFVAVMEFIWSTRRSAESEEVRRSAKGVGGSSGTPAAGGLENCSTGNLTKGKQVARRVQGGMEVRGDLRESRGRRGWEGVRTDQLERESTGMRRAEGEEGTCRGEDAGERSEKAHSEEDVGRGRVGKQEIGG